MASTSGLSEPDRVALLSSLGVGALPSAASIKHKLEQDWLVPSAGARSELEQLDWAAYALLSLLPSPSLAELTFPTLAGTGQTRQTSKTCFTFSQLSPQPRYSSSPRD